MFPTPTLGLMGAMSGSDITAGAALALEFLNSTTLDSRVTFSRGTNATLTGSNGLIQYAPHNLLTNSEDFEAAGWTKSGLNTTGTPSWVNVAVAPDGTTTAERLIEDTSTGTHQIYVLPGLGINTYTRTIYAKANGRTQFELTQESGGNARFTLTGAGTAVALGSNTVSIQALDNGWYRCSSTFTVTGIFGLYLVLYNGSTTNYTGDGSSGIFIWGAQLNVGALQSYNSTTPKNLLGFTQEPENAAWTKSNSYVQQNLLTWSQGFENSAWQKLPSGVAGTPVVTADVGAAPDGTVTADRVQLTLNGGTTSGDRALVAQSVTLVVSTTYTYSIWLRSRGASVSMGIGVDNVVGNTSITVTSSWQRFTVTGTATGTSGLAWFQLRGAQTPVQSDSADLEVWGAQLVQGSTAGDYTQTTSAAAPTRYLNWDGTLTGRKLVEDATAGILVHQAYVAYTFVVNGVYGWSLYAKAGERSWVWLNAQDGSDRRTWFNLANGTVGTNAAGNTANITSVGGGWYRCSINRTAAAASGFFSFGVTTGDAVVSYQGDGTSGIYVSDFQLSNSASVDPYVYNPQAAAASAAYYGPRFDYDPTGTPVLSGTELVTNGDFSSTANWTAGAGWTISGGAANANIVTGSNLDQTATTVSGTVYAVTFSVSNFVSGSVRIRFTGTANVNGTVRSANGTYTEYITATATNNTIRFTDGGTGFVGSVDNVSIQAVTGYTATANGLLIEEQRTNLLTYSEQFDNAAWTRTVISSVVANAAVAPDGTTTADLVTSGGSVAGSQLYQIGIAISNGAQYTATCYFKAGTSTWAILNLYDTVALNKRVWFNLSNGTVGTQDAGITGSIQSVGNGFYRCSVTRAVSSASGGVSVEFSDADGSVSVTVGRNMTVWGAQLEAGSFATSYIPTVASQVTRAADNASMLGDNFATWFNFSQGTFNATWDVGGIDTTRRRHVWIINDAGLQRLALRALDASVNNPIAAIGTGAAVISLNGVAYSANTPVKVAAAYGSNMALSQNGAAAVTDPSVASVSGPSLGIGGTVAGGTELNGHIRRITYYPRRLSNAELQAITA